ncbi:unnamed protein product [Bursaphelenchus okinawaensis]|uniref:MATH domain-containing protein n=1 Tax=Bursaphelenchus okinawaensis TaxID=465554 RepID=A0A811LPB9_9BILA|nr:unnamed protein product [Bursaphelenchus okinawaensis]CAG9125504.1 unnamed protein product [Bursaphelenchus okinawaensis]
MPSAFESSFINTETEPGTHQEEGEPPYVDTSLEDITELGTCNHLSCLRENAKRLSTYGKVFDSNDALYCGKFAADLEVVLQYAKASRCEDKIQFYSVEFLAKKFPSKKEVNPPKAIQFRVSNFKHLKDCVKSAVCYIKGIPWRVSLIPRKTNVNGVKEVSLGIFLQCSVVSYNDSWKVNAQADIVLHGEKEFKRKTNHNYTSKECDWGYSTFITYKELLNESGGYCRNDSIMVRVLVNSVEASGIMEFEDFHLKMKQYIKICELQREKGYIDKAIDCIVQAIALASYYVDVKSLRELEKCKKELISYKVKESIQRIEAGREASTIDASSVVKGGLAAETGRLVNKTARAQCERKKRKSCSSSNQNSKKKTSNAKQEFIKTVQVTNYNSSCKQVTTFVPFNCKVKDLHAHDTTMNNNNNNMITIQKNIKTKDSSVSVEYTSTKFVNNINVPAVDEANMAKLQDILKAGKPVVHLSLTIEAVNTEGELERVIVKHIVSGDMNKDQVAKDILKKHEKDWQSDADLKRFIPELKRVTSSDEFKLLLDAQMKPEKKETLSKTRSRADKTIFYKSQIGEEIKEAAIKGMAGFFASRENDREQYVPSEVTPPKPFDLCVSCEEKCKGMMSERILKTKKKLILFYKFLQGYYYSKEFKDAYEKIINFVDVTAENMKEIDFIMHVNEVFVEFEHWDPTKDTVFDLLCQFYSVLDAVLLPVDTILPSFYEMTASVITKNRMIIEAYEEQEDELDEVHSKLELMEDQEIENRNIIKDLKKENKKLKRLEKNCTTELDKCKDKFYKTDECVKSLIKDMDKVTVRIKSLERELNEKAKAEQSWKDSKKRLQNELRESQRLVKQLKEQLEKSKDHVKKLETKKTAQMAQKPIELGKIKELEKELSNYRVNESVLKFEKSIVTADVTLRMIGQRKRQGFMNPTDVADLDKQELCWSSYRQEMQRYVDVWRTQQQRPTHLRVPLEPAGLTLPPVIRVEKVVHLKPVYLNEYGAVTTQPVWDLEF